ncbi:adenylate cyclase [Rhizobium sp. Leaf391]|uniref:ATP-binding protein n=1 Tax=Rhizobium sp. Leaf391 TaxID=1736360 RepID=UPI000713E9CC|nr:adenylate/guanylate cyclase domain-containing protein [Rhizobium sp. Leaf391]KQS89023.1 adenylate cyclase [Rhizobium sp. Leaf391]
MSDVDKWLMEIGLAHLAQTFARAQIDFDSLPLLTDEDLREMQIPLGPRRKLLAAAAAMTSTQITNPSRKQPERRQLTILFCDMVGSTEYAARLDPEDYSDLTQNYLNRCSGLARSHRGFVANYIGDSLQVLFGYPVAEEDDADRALALAFDLIAAIPQMEAPDGTRPNVRIGISSGLVVVGEVKGAPEGVSTVAFGHIPSLAQRLETFADPQTVLVDQATYAAAHRSFEFRDLGAATLKGFSEPVHIWRAAGALPHGNRFGKAGLTPLVGRETEIQRVLVLGELVVRDHCARWLLLCGEPGIGKSRLLFEAAQQLPMTRIMVAQCSSTHSNSALFPFLQLLRQECGISEALPAPLATTRLETLLANCGVPVPDCLPILARLLALDQEDYPPSELTSTEQQAAVHRVFIGWLRHIARQGPLLLEIEDAQWIDPSSSNLLGVLHEEIQDSAVLVLITSRQASMDLGTRPLSIDTMKIGRLTREQAVALAENIASGVRLGSEVARSLLGKAEGVPLYVEELTRSAVELIDLDGASPSAQNRPIEVPNNLQSALLARLDRLGEAKTIAQVAAVIGREFDVKILARGADVSVAALKPQLQRLTEVGLIAPQPFADWPRYAFTHVLLQEAACGALLRENRRQLHARVADTIEETDPNTATEHPEVLAQHLYEARQFERAADHWLAAGIKVGQTWAKVEAANMFAKGLECLVKLPPSHSRDRKELRLQLERGDVLYATYGYVTREGSDAYRSVMQLSEALGDAAAAIRALDGLFGTAFNSARFDDAEWASYQLLEIGKEFGNVRASVLGTQFLGMCAFSQGRFKQARSYLDEALAHRLNAEAVGSDFPSMSLIYLSWTLQLIGEAENALELYLEAQAEARQQTDYRLAACLGNGCILMALRHDAKMLEAMINELIPLARKNGFQLWLNMALFFQGWMMVTNHQDASGLLRMQHICDNMGEQEIDKTCYLGILAESYLIMDRIPEASHTVDQALALADRTRERYFAAELLRLKGEMEASVGIATARAVLRKSTAIARKQGARTWERRAMQTLAALDKTEAGTSQAIS